jgi:hypothetical protein
VVTVNISAKKYRWKCKGWIFLIFKEGRSLDEFIACLFCKQISLLKKIIWLNGLLKITVFKSRFPDTIGKLFVDSPYPRK